MSVKSSSNAQLENNYFSNDYFDKFIVDEKILFNENKDYINSVLKPLNEKNNLLQANKNNIFANSQKDYRSIFLQKERMERNLKELDEQRKTAEENARREALKKGLPLSEADRIAKEAGQKYKKQISEIEFREKPSLFTQLGNSAVVMAKASNEYNTARRSYLSTDNELTSLLFSQTQLALDINMQTTQWYGLVVQEMKMQELNQNR